LKNKIFFWRAALEIRNVPAETAGWRSLCRVES